MKELKTLKNLLLDVLADGGEAIKINALQTLKIDQEIKGPIIINQSQNVLNVSIRKSVVEAIRTLDSMDPAALTARKLRRTDELYLAVVKEIISEGDLKSFVDNVIFRTVAVCGGNKTKAAELLGVSPRTLRYKELDRKRSETI